MTIDEIVAAASADAKAEGGPWLITRDMLLEAGALDCPPEWRKSLTAGTPAAAADDAETLPLFAAIQKVAPSEQVRSAENQVK
ncbi:MAG: hypothetical protein IT450_01905 [Phycisphaerales bacterium]|nr:hypothetical protein [Phycisphaerales bacterium]